MSIASITMTMKHKLIITLILLAIVPMAISVVVSTWVARDTGWEALLDQTELRLISERESKKFQIETAFDWYKKQIITSSSNGLTIKAANDLSSSYEYYKDDIGIYADPAKMKVALKTYYQDQFGAEYVRKNGEKLADIDSLINKLDDNSIALQHNLIAANENPLGEKHKLDKFKDISDYSAEHERYHPSYRNFIEYFGYYDLFIVDPTSGNIVYSVYKELDYATSLIDGPFANSGIGRAFKAANASSDPDFVAIEDFDSYIPSYNAPAAFMASPIFRDKRKVGILIFQLPVEKIDEITTSKQSWQQVGLGQSGETYLVGADSKMRSVSRFLVEDPDAYLLAVKSNGLDEETANLILKRGTTTSLQPIQSEAFMNAAAGESGFNESVDYRGVPVLSAYAKLDIPGLDWIILSEMDIAEAQVPSTNLSDTLLNSSAVVALILALLAIGCGWLFSIRLTRPIEKLQQDIKGIEKNSDLATRLKASPSDVTAEIVESLNQTFEKIHSIVSTVSTNSDQMLQAAENVSQVSSAARQGMTRQNSETDSVATAMEEMTATVGEIATNASDANTAASDANQHAQHGNKTVSAATQSINDLAEAVKDAAQVINKLASDSESIGSVLDVIRGIAEQTNLLALNAAIEAARAGEQGRGFAVVADEVRTLASRTQESTAEIQSMIQTLQSGAANAVQVMSNGEKQAENSVNQAKEAADALIKITESVTEITEMNRHIAEASEQQRQMSNDVSNSIHAISEVSASTAKGSQQMESQSTELTSIANSLKEAVGQFRL